MGTLVVQIVVVAGIERSARTRRPAKQRLRAQSRVESIVVENQPREGRFGELVSTAEVQDLDAERDAIRIVAAQPLRVETQRRAQRISRLIGNPSIELKQTAATRIEWR